MRIFLDERERRKADLFDVSMAAAVILAFSVAVQVAFVNGLVDGEVASVALGIGLSAAGVLVVCFLSWRQLRALSGTKPMGK